jgi:hypothetical protein
MLATRKSKRRQTTSKQYLSNCRHYKEVFHERSESVGFVVGIRCVIPTRIASSGRRSLLLLMINCRFVILFLVWKIGVGSMLPAILNHVWCRIANPLHRIGYPLGQKQARRGHNTALSTPSLIIHSSHKCQAQLLGGLPIPISIGWLSPVQPPGMVSICTPRSLMTLTTLAIMWHQYETSKINGCTPGGASSMYGLRTKQTRSFMTRSSIQTRS